MKHASKVVELFLDKTVITEFLTDKNNLYPLEREAQERLRLQAMEWLEETDARRTAYADLIIRLEDVIAHPNS